VQIAGLTRGYADPGTLGRRNEAPPAAGSIPETEATRGRGTTGEGLDIFAQVVSGYDLHDITPRDFSEMLRELRDAGVLSEMEYADLGQIRLEMDAEGLDPDDSIDVLDFYQKVAQRARPDGQAEGEHAAHLASIDRRLDWLEKVAILQESPDAAGLNALV